ncbi:MAG: 5-formyltetrahydrofolate cyclo-ligase [Bacteroidota bacterium]
MVQEEKEALRKQIRALKKQVSSHEKIRRSKSILDKVEKLEAFQLSHVVMVYWSMSDEVHTHDFIKKWTKFKSIVLPVVKGDKLELRFFEGEHSLIPGEHYGIMEPVGTLLQDIYQIDMIIVPGVAFDKQNNRLGRGKAYYDKLLKKNRAYKVGVCFDFQVVDQVPVDENDVPVNMVISED